MNLVSKLLKCNDNNNNNEKCIEYVLILLSERSKRIDDDNIDDGISVLIILSRLSICNSTVNNEGRCNNSNVLILLSYVKDDGNTNCIFIAIHTRDENSTNQSTINVLEDNSNIDIDNDDVNNDNTSVFINAINLHENSINDNASIPIVQVLLNCINRKENNSIDGSISNNTSVLILLSKSVTHVWTRSLVNFVLILVSTRTDEDRIWPLSSESTIDDSIIRDNIGNSILIQYKLGGRDEANYDINVHVLILRVLLKCFHITHDRNVYDVYVRMIIKSNYVYSQNESDINNNNISTNHMYDYENETITATTLTTTKCDDISQLRLFMGCVYTELFCLVCVMRRDIVLATCLQQYAYDIILKALFVFNCSILYWIFTIDGEYQKSTKGQDLSGSYQPL